MTQVEEKFPKRRRWLQFSLRTLLILPVLAGLACHWAAERSRREQALVEISKIGGAVYYQGFQKYKYGEVDVKLTFSGFGDCLTGIVPFTPWEPLEEQEFDQSKLYYLRYVPRLVSVDLSWKAVGDEGVKHLSALSSLKELSLLSTEITDENIKRLHEALPNCEIWTDKEYDWLPRPKGRHRDRDTEIPAIQ